MEDNLEADSLLGDTLAVDSLVVEEQHHMDVVGRYTTLATHKEVADTPATRSLGKRHLQEELGVEEKEDLCLVGYRSLLLEVLLHLLKDEPKSLTSRWLSWL